MITGTRRHHEPQVEGRPLLFVTDLEREAIADVLAELLVVQLEAELATAEATR